MRTTVTLDDDLAAHVDAQRPSTEESDAEAVRACIRRSQELAECRERVADLEQEIERLEREKRLILEEREEQRLILEEREEHDQLVRAVERERTLEEERAEAGLATRAKWWLFGRDGGE